MKWKKKLCKQTLKNKTKQILNHITRLTRFKVMALDEKSSGWCFPRVDNPIHFQTRVVFEVATDWYFTWVCFIAHTWSTLTLHRGTGNLIFRNKRANHVSQSITAQWNSVKRSFAHNTLIIVHNKSNRWV